MLKIGDFSKLSRISNRMLHHYNEIRLLIPDDVDDFTEILTKYENPLELKRFLLLQRDEPAGQETELKRKMQRYVDVGMQDTKSPEELVTEVCYPVRKKA